MTNYFFTEESITENDLLFVCYMIERTARTLLQRNSYVVNQLGYEGLLEKLSLADVLHCENPYKVVSDWTEEYQLETGNFDIMNVNPELVDQIPTEIQMGNVYKRFILQTLDSQEDYAQAIIRVYNSTITEIIDNYNTGAYYAPSYIISKAYYAGSFNSIY